MAKRKRSATTKSIEKKLLEGRCQKSGKDYIPWYKVQDVASMGTSLKSYLEKTGRQHHTLSRLESAFLYRLEWYDAITEIKEQYAILDIAETIRIATQLGYKHPTDPKTHNLVPVTTDFLFTIEKEGEEIKIARTLKYEKDLSKRTLQKFEIERIYWEKRGVDWGIVTETILDEALTKNLIWVRKAKSLKGIPDLDTHKVLIIEQMLWNEINNSSSSIAEVATKVTNELCLSPGTGLFVVRYLIANKIWIVDMNKPIIPHERIVILERIIPRLF